MTVKGKTDRKRGVEKTDTEKKDRRRKDRSEGKGRSKEQKRRIEVDESG